MRRIPLIAALVVTMLPITLATTTASAAAATGTLTVRTYDRAGGKTSSDLKIMNLTTRMSYTARSFTAKKLPKGKYAVITDIRSAKDNSNTLGARVVKVAGKTTTTIDARQGRNIYVGLNPAPGPQYYRTVAAAICSDHGSADISLETSNNAGQVFVIPNASKRLRFAYSYSWNGSAEGKLWIVNGTTGAGVPGGVSRTVQTSSLATVNVWERRGPAEAMFTNLRIVGRSGCQPGYGSVARAESTAGVARILASAGTWSLETDWSGEGKDGSMPSVGFDWRTLKLAAGKTYSQTFFGAVWGPSENLPYTWNKKLTFDTSRMFTDPVADEQHEASERSLVTLTDTKGKVLKKQWRKAWGSESAGTFTAKLPKAGWYNLQVDAHRYHPELVAFPAGMLSTNAQAVFRFKADPKAKPRFADVYLPRMLPYGLDLNNKAKSGSKTVVQIRPDRQRTIEDVKLAKVAIKAVTVQASYDGGKTWRSMPVRKVGGGWQATVQNPASGAVALRSRITSTKGAYAQVSVVRAYTVG